MEALPTAPRAVREIDEQDRVLCHQPHEHDEADDGKQIQCRSGQQQREKYADQRKRQRRHDRQRLREARELRRENQIDENDREAERRERRLERLLHVLRLATDVEAISGRQRRRRLLDDAGHIGIDVA